MIPSNISRSLRRPYLAVLLITVSSFAADGSLAAKAPVLDYDVAVPATAMAEPPRPVKIVTIPEPLPLSGQLKPITSPPGSTRPIGPRSRVGAANAAARVQPVRDGFLNAIQQYSWSEGALYQVYAAPGQVTDIALQEGERLVGSGPVAAGDTVRWIIGDTISGTGTGERVHILVKPTRPNLVTNMVVNTDRRTYHLELRGTPSTYMASVSWTYPQDQLIALRQANAITAATAPVATGVDIAALNFRYSIDGDKPAWRPVRAFDDGRQVFIEFPEGIAQGEMPPLFVIGAGGTGELVNYRVSGRHMIVDRLFAAAELRLGDKKSQQRVRIVREGSRSGKGAR